MAPRIARLLYPQPATILDMTHLLSAANCESLRDYIAAGALIITANRRLERALTAAVTPAACQVAPPIKAADNWVGELWLELQDAGVEGCQRSLITSYQARKLWQEVVEQDPDSAILSPAQLARQAAEAARLVADWQLDVSDIAFTQRDEYRSFQGWYHQYRQLLEQRQLADAAYSRHCVQQAFAADVLAGYEQIILYGFDAPAPALEALVQAAALQVEHWQPTHRSTSRVMRTCAANTENELRAAALWSRTRVERDPSCSLAVIVPELHSQRSQVERIFNEVYETASWLPDQERLVPPFNFSAGVPLSSTPLVADALLLLSLNLRHIQPDAWRRLLLSPFWGQDLDACRYQLLLKLNQSSKTRFSTSELRRMAETASDDTSWPLAQMLTDFAQLVRRRPSKQSYAEWAELFSAQLAQLNWPGLRIIDSPEYQQQQHFYQLLDEFSRCDIALRTPVTLNEALAALREMADAATFQAQTPLSPVQILGVLEGAGLQFDQCWITGMTDISWPPAAKPNPFIPLAFQVEKRMPRASSERELVYARALTQRFREAADQVIFSWPGADGDVGLQPSQLILDSLETPLTDLASANSPLQQFIETVADSADFETIDCSRAPAWDDLSHPLPGGTGILRLQALCPFNAFAVYRLGAHANETPRPGFNAAERGTIVHDLLAGIWHELKTHEQLVSMTDESLEQLIRDQVSSTLSPWRQRRSDLLHPRFYQLEQERLFRLAYNWLVMERERPPFTVIATESPLTVALPVFQAEASEEAIGEAAKLALLSGRIDRVDQLASGKRLIIDYKTGSVSQSSWQGERPTDLQLPLYALAEPEEVAAIAFAQVNAKRTAFCGVGQLHAGDGDIPGIVSPDKIYQSQLPPEWQDTLAFWRDKSTLLLEEFLQGNSEALMFNKSQAQFYRHLECLNRLSESLE